MRDNTPEETLFLEDIPHSEHLEDCREALTEFLDKHFQFDEEAEDYTVPDDSVTRKYVIRLIADNTAINIEIQLPDNDAAQELAKIVGGEVITNKEDA